MKETDQSARLLDSMAEVIRQDAAETKTTARRKMLLGVAAGLEVAACVMRDGAHPDDGADAEALVRRFQETHFAYLLEKDIKDFHRRPPKLFVKKVVKGAARKKQG